MFDRYDTPGRGTSLREIDADFEFDGGAVHIEELAVDHHDPFGGQNPHPQRWLVTTCVIGLAGSVVVGGALMGLFGYVLPRDVTEVGFKSVFWQQSSSTLKGDFVGTVADLGPSPAATPYKRIAVSYEPQAGSGLATGRTILTARHLAGTLAAAYPSITDDALPYASRAKPTVLDAAIRTASLTPDNVTTILKAAPPAPEEKHVALEKGDTLVGLLTALGATPDAAQAMTAAVELIYPVQAIREGQEISIIIEHRPDFYGRYVPYPMRLVFSPVPGEQVVVEADHRGRYLARVDGEGDSDGSTLLANLPYQRVKAKISSSLYTNAKEQGVPEHVIAEMMRVHSYDVDFQREIREGDEFEVFFGRAEDASAKRKVLLYSGLTLQGKQHGYYRFTAPDDGITDYYDETGQSVRKALIRTPISGARMSSGFGMRKHPILGYTRMHAGIDFAAPTGTPIKAAGDGVIEMAGRFGAYGNYIRIRHANSYKTAYAHMSRIARGVQPGTRVRQGQVIGYVGSTGRSTGPHLHYEILVKDRQVNPMKVRIADGRKLEGEMLKRFNEAKEKIEAMMRAAPTPTQVAQASDSTSN